MAADLHCHTKLSDGSVGIEDLIVIANKSGINTIAITDHDCIAGTVRGQVIGKRYGVTVIPAVELSAFDNEAGKSVHIISYLADSPDRLEAICRKTSVARKRAGQIMMLKVAARFPITSEFIINHASGSTNLYKQHIMHALMDAGYTDELFGELYHKLFSTDSENNILAPTKYPDVQTVIDEIHGAGGRHHLDALFLELKQALRTDGLDLGHDDVGLVFLHHGLEGIAVEHGEHLALVGHLHGRCVVITVAGDHILSCAHGGYHELLTEFT